MLKLNFSKDFDGKIKDIVLLCLVVMMVVLALGLGFFAVRNFLVNLKYGDISPAYLQRQYAFVVDSSARGVDSVAVTLRDFHNFMTIYQTFTDSTGKFELFNDFSSHRLSAASPVTFELYVTIGDYKDTIQYSFKKYRVGHFKKVSGPDSIVVDPSRKNFKTMALTDTQRVSVDEYFSYVPYARLLMKPGQPQGLAQPVQGWERVSYGTLRIVDKNIYLASLSGPLPQMQNEIANRFQGNNQARYYLLDRNGNHNLTDDALEMWASCNDFPKSAINEVTCHIRPCCVTDSVIIGQKIYGLQLKTRELQQSKQVILYRRGDALRGIITKDGKRIPAVVWDRAFTNFRDLSKVQIALDLDSNGLFSSQVGQQELFEIAQRSITINENSFKIDSIYNNGTSFLYSSINKVLKFANDVTVGSWMGDFHASYTKPLSLHQECGQNDFVVLYFFAGQSRAHMEDLTLKAFLTIMKNFLGKVQLIGINRKAIGGSKYLKAPVIEENCGWHGPLVSRFRNHLDQEIICLDNLCTVIYRGIHNRVGLERLWNNLKRKDLSKALIAYDKLTTHAIIGEVSYDPDAL